MLANRSVDPASTSLTHRVRQQAGSYRFCAASGVVCQDANPADAGKRHRSHAHHRYSHEIHCCRSRLAGEHVVGSSINVTDTPRSPASRLLQVLRSIRGLCQTANPAGAGKQYHSQAAPPYSDEIHFCAAFGGSFQPANPAGAGNRRHRSQALPQPGAPPLFA